MAKEKIRIDKINAPYNFVPLNEMVVIPEWGGEISQDLPFSDGEDGCIDVIVSNLSPIITCDDKSEKNNEGKYVRCPAHVEKDEEKHYYSRQRLERHASQRVGDNDVWQDAAVQR